MAQTTYSTLSVSYDDLEEDKSQNLRKVTSAAAVLCAVVVMFFAGRVYEGQTTPFTHEEVLDIAAKCGEGEFIGGCVTCKTCADYEFENGGCSFFKDAFCSYCEPIKNCKRENVLCTTREDQVCIECDCDDPIGNWTDVELGAYLEYELFDRDEYAEKSQEDATYSCYWNEQCLPCTVCKFGYFETARCTQTSDTECKKCSACGADDWVSTPCTYHQDTECAACTHFMGWTEGKWTAKECHRHTITTSMYQGADAVPGDCTQCSQEPQADTLVSPQESEFYSEICQEFIDSECTPCTLCDATRTVFSIGGEYIRGGDDDGLCIQGNTGEYGRDTVCVDCTDASERPGYYESERCDPTGTTDAVWTLCTQCLEGEWEHTLCQLSTDTICPPCYPINHCKSSDTMCSDGTSELQNDSVCVGPGADTKDGPAFACQEGFYGLQCQYWRTYGDCGSGPGYRERTVKTGKFRGETNGEFIAWCQLMCDEFPDCLAFEVGDEGAAWDGPGTASAERNPEEKQIMTKPQSLCSLKDTAMGSVELPSDPAKDCFSNIRRQPEDKAREVMAQVSPTLLPPVNNGLIYAGVGALPMIEGNWKDAVKANNVMLQRAIARDAALEAAEVRR
jgi:hypothetical protein